MRMSVKIDGLSKLEEAGLPLDEAQQEFADKVGSLLARGIGEAVKSRSGRLAASWRGRAESRTTIKVYSDSAYAKAEDRGAYITPKGHSRLRFEVDGRTVFAKAVRLPGQKYVKKGLRSRNKQVKAEFDRIFNEVENKLK